LYHIGTNPDVQTKLQQETKALLPTDNSPVTSTTLNNASYIKAVLKETFRLNPISVGVSRILAEDAVLGGYFVPQGVLYFYFPKY
jgi:ecdysteroid 25-hydroxylase CYP302A1